MSHIRSIFPDITLHSPAGAQPGTGVGEAGSRAPWREALGRWLNRLRERDEMLALTERERRDAGITAYDVAFECRKMPWRD